MSTIVASDLEIKDTEELLLPHGCGFPDDARDVIKCWHSAEVNACPGSGKTTVLLAKLKILADHMPLENGAGICVLSHTNVAVNEIKNRMANYADKLLSYPNYVGTIQTFIDKFITIPYLRTLTSEPIKVIDDLTYAQHLLYLIDTGKQYWQLKSLINRQYDSGHYSDKSYYVQGLYLNKDGSLHHISLKSRALAGSTRPSSQQFKNAKEEMLKNGLVTYDDAYRYSEKAVNENKSLVRLLSRRFRYVFVDEYQDCKDEQRRILDAIFDKTVSSVMYIGDPDQAIYNSDKDQSCDWLPASNALVIASANRYSQEIADILTLLRTDRVPILSNRGPTTVKPAAIVYDESNISNVLPAFIDQLVKHDLTDPDGIYKAIGWIKSETAAGTKICDYWDGYKAGSKGTSSDTYWSLIDDICESLQAGKLYKAESTLRNLICRIINYLGIKSNNGYSYTSPSIHDKLLAEHRNEYADFLLQISKLEEYNRESMNIAIKGLLSKLITSNANADSILTSMPAYFMGEGSGSGNKSIRSNIYHDASTGINVQFSTIHKVKGETHDATLYLETEYKNKSDLDHVLPLFQGKKLGSGKIDHYCRKCVYVGFSRPRKFLCVAMKKETFEKAAGAFNGWDIIQI